MNLKDYLGKNFYFKRWIDPVLVLPPDLIPKVNKKQKKAMKEAEAWILKYGSTILYLKGLIRKDEFVYMEENHVFVNTIIKPTRQELIDIAKICGEEQFQTVIKMTSHKKIVEYLRQYYCIIK
jgi:hypothetical protein